MSPSSPRAQAAGYANWLWTVGEYDIVKVVEFPDDETATAALLQVGSLGTARSNTMRAFSADEMTTIIGQAG